MNKRIFVMLALALLAPIKTQAEGLRDYFIGATAIGALFLVMDIASQSNGPNFTSPVKIQEKEGKKSLTLAQSKAGYQVGQTCGFHAVKNSLGMAQALHNGSKNRSFLSDTTVDYPDHTWRQMVEGYQTDMINEYSQQVYPTIFKDIFPHTRIIPKNQLTEDQKQAFGDWCTTNNCLNPVCSDAYKQECALRGWDPQHERTCKAQIDALLQGLYTHGTHEKITVFDLLPDNMEQIDTRSRDNKQALEELKRPGIHPVVLLLPNHWISIVIDRRKVNEVYYFIADSLNINRRYAPQVMHLMQLLETTSVFKAYQESRRKGFWRRMRSWLP